MFESVNARMDRRMEGRQLESHPLSSPGVFGSGELKLVDNQVYKTNYF